MCKKRNWVAKEIRSDDVNKVVVKIVMNLHVPQKTEFNEYLSKC